MSGTATLAIASFTTTFGAAITATIFMLRTASRRLFLQRLKFSQWLKLMLEDLVPLTLDLDNDRFTQGTNITHLALAVGCANPLVPLRQFLTRFDILLIFIDQAAAQAPTHPGDFPAD